MPVLSMQPLARRLVEGRYPNLRRESRGQSVLSAEAKSILSESVQAMVDPVSGALKRDVFFQELHRAIKETVPELETTGFKPQGNAFSAVVGDVAGLGMHNARSHQYGDRVLRRTTITMLREFSGQVVGRIGGDEFAVVARMSAADAKSASEVVFADVSRYPYHRLDIDQANFEDVDLFLREYPLPKERRTKFLANLLVDIAMNRAQITKYWRSAQILANLWPNTVLYRKIAPFFIKGAGNISAEEVERFASLSGAQLSSEAMMYAITRKGTQMVTPYERAVFKVAQEAFVLTT